MTNIITTLRNLLEQDPILDASALSARARNPLGLLAAPGAHTGASPDRLSEHTADAFVWTCSEQETILTSSTPQVASLQSEARELLAVAIRSSENAWSIGCFGVSAEFMRAPFEPAKITESQLATEIVTERGAMRLSTASHARPIAYQSPWGEGDAWTSGVLFCVPSVSKASNFRFRHIGPDAQAIRPRDVSADLFDLGVGVGHVRMCIRTRDEEVLGAAREMEGQDLLGERGASLLRLLRAKSPVRVMISPLGRIEVYSQIPPDSGCSPLGPHTHLLPALAGLRRRHSSNVPIPRSLQAVLMLHPRSPWRNREGERVVYDRTAAKEFDELLLQFGDPEAIAVIRRLEAAVLGGEKPERFAFPTRRHLRAQARVTLRRLALEGRAENVGEWFAAYDRPSKASHSEHL